MHTGSGRTHFAVPIEPVSIVSLQKVELMLVGKLLSAFSLCTCVFVLQNYKLLLAVITSVKL